MLDLLVKAAWSSMAGHEALCGGRGDLGRRIGRWRVSDSVGASSTPTGSLSRRGSSTARPTWMLRSCGTLGTCSCYHGVTSVVMSSCGFTLARCKPVDREWSRASLLRPGHPAAAMAAGVEWTRETFPEYSAVVERRLKALTYAMYVGHSALRMYVMGRRALTDAATDERSVPLARLARSRCARRRGRFDLTLAHASHPRRHAGRKPLGGVERSRGDFRRHDGARHGHIPDRAGAPFS